MRHVSTVFAGRQRLAYWRLTVAATVLLGLPAIVGAQDLSGFERRRIEQMLERGRDEIAKQYYDSTLRGFDLAREYDTARQRIDAASGMDGALAAVAQFALDLHDSHTFFVPPQRTVWAEYGWDLAMTGDSCFVRHVALGSDAEAQGVHAGDAVISISGYQPNRDNLWQLLYLYRWLRPVRSLRTALVSPAGVARTLDLAATIHERQQLVDLTGRDGGGDIVRLIRDAEKAMDEQRALTVESGDDILIWKLPTFAVSDGQIRDIFKQARNRKTLILDVRGNSGGPVSTMLTLIGQLSHDSVAIGIQQERRKRVPLVAKGAGENAFTGHLIVLVDSRSASASEVTARAVQLAQRGRVLGDRTAGAVMRGQFRQFLLGGQTAIIYGFNITEADLLMSDGARLEGAGVIPDELILPTGSDLAAERDPVLARAMTLAGTPMNATDAGALLRRDRR